MKGIHGTFIEGRQLRGAGLGGGGGLHEPTVTSWASGSRLWEDDK